MEEEIEKTKEEYEKELPPIESNFLDTPISDLLNDGGQQPSRAKFEARFPRIYEMILYEKLGYIEMRDQIVKEFGVSPNNAERHMRMAKARLKDRFNEKGEEIINEQLARMFDLLSRCKKDGNKKVERELLADLSKIYGLEQKKLDITSNGEPITINISIED
jgi:hypothetical protein